MYPHSASALTTHDSAGRKRGLSNTAGSTGDFRALTTLLYALVLLANLLDATSAGASDVCLIPKVGVDADEFRDTFRPDILYHDISRPTIVAAVAT